MNPTIKEQIRFVLEDDNELMQAALDPNSGLDEEDRHMNQELIQRHERILTKLDRDELPSQEDLQLIRDVNEIHLNDTVNLNGHHEHAWELDAWLDNMMELSKDEAMRIIEEYLEHGLSCSGKGLQGLTHAVGGSNAE